MQVLRGVDIEIEQGKTYGLIGPNGSGKTTFFNILTGYYKPDKGTIEFKGDVLNGLPPHRIARKGIGRTFQIPRPLGRLTVFQNLLAASPNSKLEQKKKAKEIMSLLELDQAANAEANSISYGQKKQLDLARVLMTSPELVLLDEPMSGLSTNMTLKMIEYLRAIRSDRCTYFIIEHNMGVVMNLCDIIFVIDEGIKIAEGAPSEIQQNERVIAAYIGE